MALTPQQTQRRRNALMLAAMYAAVGATRNLLTEGGFDNDSGWTKGTGWTITGGAADFTATGSASDLSQSLSLTPGKRYRLDIKLTVAAGTLTVRLGGTTDQVSYTATGNYAATLIAESSTTTIVFRAGTTFTGTITEAILHQID